MDYESKHARIDGRDLWLAFLAKRLDKDSLGLVFSARIFAEAFVVKARRTPASMGREKNYAQRKKDHFWM